MSATFVCYSIVPNLFFFGVKGTSLDKRTQIWRVNNFKQEYCVLQPNDNQVLKVNIQTWIRCKMYKLLLYIEMFLHKHTTSGCVMIHKIKPL